MKKHISIYIFLLGIFLSPNILAKTCFSKNDISTEIIDSSKSENGEIDEINIYIKKNKKVNIKIPLLEYTSIDDVLSFVDVDFDGKKEILVKYDNDSSHSTTHAVVKINCDGLVTHPLISELGFYNIDADKKELTVFFKDGFRIGEKKYCFTTKGYLCAESLAITDQITLLKKYNKTGTTIYRRAVNIDNHNEELSFNINKKTYLYKDQNKKTRMYLIKGDKVTLLDEKTDNSDKKWYFINYKGKKDLNMWIMAEALDLEPKTTEPKQIEKPTPKEPASQTKTATPKPIEITKQELEIAPPKNAEVIKAEKAEPIEKSASGSISLTFLASLFGLLAWRVS